MPLGMSKTVINVANRWLSEAFSVKRPKQIKNMATQKRQLATHKWQVASGMRHEARENKTRDKCCFNKFVVQAMAIRWPESESEFESESRAINYALSRCVQWNFYPETQLNNYKSWCSCSLSTRSNLQSSRKVHGQIIMSIAGVGHSLGRVSRSGYLRATDCYHIWAFGHLLQLQPLQTTQKTELSGKATL